MKKLVEYYKVVTKKRYTTLASSIAFFFMINLSSIFFLTIICAKLININFSLNINKDLLPIDFTQFLTYILETSDQSSNYSFIFIITILWGTSSLFYQLLRSGEIIYEEKRIKYQIITRITSFIAVIFFIILLVTTFIIVILSEYLLKSISAGVFNRLFPYLLIVTICFIVVLFFNLIIPPNKIKIKNCLMGAFFTVFYWFLSTYIFTLYIKFFANFNQIYGTLTFIIIFMLWIYLLTQGLIIGFIINYKRGKNKQSYS